MFFFNKLILNIYSLKFAISLLIFIAFSSGIGTFIPQGMEKKDYLESYKNSPILGFIDGDKILLLELDHIYTSKWFLISVSYTHLTLPTMS